MISQNGITITIRPNYSTYMQYKDTYLRELADLLGDLGTVETPEIPRPTSYGVTLWEVLAIYIATDKLAFPFLEEFAKKMAERLAQWVLRRNERGEGPGQKQKTQIAIYGPDGSVLKTVAVDNKGHIDISDSR